MGRVEKMGDSYPGGNLNGSVDVGRLKKRGLVVAGEWPDVDHVVVWDANGSRSELSVQPTVVLGKRRTQTVFVPASAR